MDGFTSFRRLPKVGGLKEKKLKQATANLLLVFFRSLRH